MPVNFYVEILEGCLDYSCFFTPAWELKLAEKGDKFFVCPPSREIGRPPAWPGDGLNEELALRGGGPGSSGPVSN